MTDQNPQDSVVIERTFDAPVDVLWQMWTDPDLFASWYGPQGASIPVSELDLRVGGARKVCMEMETPDGSMQMWFVGEVVEIVEHERLVYTESMADADGNAMPGPSGHPMDTEVRVEFASSGDGTKLVLTHVGVPADSPGAAGWNMALDKLAAAV